MQEYDISKLLDLDVDGKLQNKKLNELVTSKELNKVQQTIIEISFIIIKKIKESLKTINQNMITYDFKKLKKVLENLAAQDENFIIQNFNIDVKRIIQKYTEKNPQELIQLSLSSFKKTFIYLNCFNILNIKKSINIKLNTTKLCERISSKAVNDFFQKFIAINKKGPLKLDDLKKLVGMYFFEPIAQVYLESLYMLIGDVSFTSNNLGVTSNSKKNLGLSYQFGEIDALAVIESNVLKKKIFVITSVKTNLSKINRAEDEVNLTNIFSLYTSKQFSLAEKTDSQSAVKLSQDKLSVIDETINFNANNSIDCIYIKAFSETNEEDNNIDIGTALIKTNSILIRFESLTQVLTSLAKNYYDMQTVLDIVTLFNDFDNSNKFTF